jgi:hypothetical protein
MSGIFISYRRDDSAAEARRLFDRLAARFGADRIFLDAVTLQPGQDFAEAIHEKVAFCDALVVVIGPRWLDSRTTDGRRRLDEPDDWVRLEIASALREDIAVIPALVNGAALPSARQLPAPIAPLTNYQVVELRAAQLDRDLERLEQALDPLLPRETRGISWLALLTRRHRALDPLDLRRPGTSWRAFTFLLVMMLIGEALRLPTAARAGLPYWNVGYLVMDVIVNTVEWLAIGVVLHLAMRAFGGRASLPQSIVIVCYLAAWLPVIALSQMPVWGLRVSVAKDMADVAWRPGTALETVTRFVQDLGVFGTVRVAVSFVLATVLWALLLTSLYAALRTVHHVRGPKALAAFALGGAAAVIFIALFYAPVLGAVYAAFGIPAP